jgi:hypothetical protein
LFELPVYRLRITGTTELLDISFINKDTGIENYKFKVYISGYYSDPIIDPAFYKSIKITIIYINKQTCFTLVTNNLFKVILGFQKTRSGSRFFIKREYIFSFGPIENGSYIKLIYISFNSTNYTEGIISEL